MALPLIPFVAGVAVGSLITYGYKEKAVHDRIAQGAEDLYAWAKDGMNWVMGWIPGLAGAKPQAPEVVEAVRAEAAEQIEAVAEKTAEVAEAISEAVVKPAARKAKEVAAEVKHP